MRRIFLQPSDHGITDARFIFAVRDAYLAEIALATPRPCQ